MAELDELTINVGINIGEETAQRCCQILQMYLADNPDKTVTSQQGEYPMVWIQDRVAESEILDYGKHWDGHTEKDVTRLLSLEREDYKDCISRQAAQAKIKNICDEYRLSYEDGERKPATGGSAYALGHAFDDLPPVTQQQKKIWVVTYWDKGEEPTVTVFDNRKAAKHCYKAFKGSHDGCCIDETMLYHSFTIV